MTNSKTGFWCVFFLLLGTAKRLEAGAFNQAAMQMEYSKTSVWSVEKRAEVSKVSEKQSKEVRRKLKKSKKLASKPKGKLSPKDKINIWIGIFLSLLSLPSVWIGLTQMFMLFLIIGVVASALLTIWWIIRLIVGKDAESGWVRGVPTLACFLLALVFGILGYFLNITWALAVGCVLMLPFVILVLIIMANAETE